THSFNMDAYVEVFDGLDLQEAVSLEGWTAGLDFTLPINRTMQFRFLLPVRTEADGVLVDGGDDIDIKGWGGTFRFATLAFEHLIVGENGGPNRLAYMVGAGVRTANLETDTPDRYNHQGRSLHLGIRYDRVLARGGVLMLDTELRFYEESDDLNPGDLIDDRFFWGTINGAWLLKERGPFTPGVELTAALGENWTALSVVPELFIAAGDVVDLKFGVPIGVTTDAPNWGAQFRLTANF
ncbi:MAG: hypothetical protein AAGE43_14315, partial [Pseudomonadota bacterium]